MSLLLANSADWRPKTRPKIFCRRSSPVQYTVFKPSYLREWCAQTSLTAGGPAAGPARLHTILLLTICTKAKLLKYLYYILTPWIFSTLLFVELWISRVGLVRIKFLVGAFDFMLLFRIDTFAVLFFLLSQLLHLWR